LVWLTSVSVNSRIYRTVVIVTFAMLALVTMSYLSGSFAKGDAKRAVEAVQDHLMAGGGEAAVRAVLADRYGMANPELSWWGRITSNFYGIVRVTLVAKEAGREEEFVWEFGLVSGELAPKNDNAAVLLRSVESQDGAGSPGVAG
jgi:hypothetical protein